MEENRVRKNNSVQETVLGLERGNQGLRGKDDNFLCSLRSLSISRIVKDDFSKHKISCIRDRASGSSWRCNTLTSVELCSQYRMPHDNKPEKRYAFTLSLTLPGDKSLVSPHPK